MAAATLFDEKAKATDKSAPCRSKDLARPQKNVPEECNVIHNNAKVRTLDKKAEWKSSPYFKFLETATKKELLLSQTGFFFAVQAFPRMLARLAGMIETTEARLLIVENIWEEHGHGKLTESHQNTFKTVLQALGNNSSGALERNPVIDAWIQHVMGIVDKRELFHALAGVEYIYAMISETIAEALCRCNHEEGLDCEQIHYGKHAELDWEHGKELLEAMGTDMAADGVEVQFDERMFDQAQRDFMRMYDAMAFPTVADMKLLFKQQQVAFYHTREDQEVMGRALASITKEKKRVLTTCSGGEHVLYALGRDDVAMVTAVDMNPKQIEVCQSKITTAVSTMVAAEKRGKTDIRTAGRFEVLFSWVSSYLTHPGFGNRSQEKGYISSTASADNAHICFIVSRVFRDDVLREVFTEAAIKHSPRNAFVKHFIKVFERQVKILQREASTFENDMARSILLGEALPVLGLPENALTRVHYIEANLGNIEAFFSEEQEYDVIDLSNCGDWMEEADFHNAVDFALTNRLGPGGKLILRRLQGKYDLTKLVKEMQAKKFLSASQCYTTESEEDRTMFYSQIVVITKVARHSRL